MASVTVFTKARTQAIEDKSIVSGSVNASGRLILKTKDNTSIDAGSVLGPKGDTGVGLVATSLSSTQVINDLKTPGVYTQESNSVATTARGYPCQYAGLLEVFATPAGNLSWQRYSVYNSGPYAGAVWARASSSTGVWSTWRCLNPTKLAAKSVCDTALNLTATQTDISGTQMTITALGPDDVFVVSCNVDIVSTGTTATTALIRMGVDNTAQTEQAIWQNGAISGLRSMITQQWLITGLAAGDHTIKLTGTRSGGADAMVRVNATHTTLVVFRL